MPLSAACAFRHLSLVKRLLRIFWVGLIVGVLGTAAFAWKVPVVDVHRERSYVSVQTNGGNRENFRINLPEDRILVGLPEAGSSIPAGLKWPGRKYLGDMQAELFKIRDRENTVIGVGSRLASSSESSGAFIEWALHFPARGTLYVELQVTPSADGFRNGTVQSGTREFANFNGNVRERFVSAKNNDGDNQGHIEIETVLVGVAGDET